MISSGSRRQVRLRQAPHRYLRRQVAERSSSAWLRRLPKRQSTCCCSSRERRTTALAPMTIEALVADRFVPIVADDTTRALGESGLLSMAFADPPTRSGLFGKKNLTWLRLTPKANTSEKWTPALRGAYLECSMGKREGDSDAGTPRLIGWRTQYGRYVSRDHRCWIARSSCV